MPASRPLTLPPQSVKWHLRSHWRRVERHRAMESAGIAPPTKWSGALQEAYMAAVAAQGGLHAARPMPLFEALQAEFPELTQQIVRCRLQKQRKRAAAAGTVGGAARGQQRQPAAAGAEAAGYSFQPGARPSISSAK